MKVVLSVAWGALLALALLAPGVEPDAVGDFRVRKTVWVSLAFWFAAFFVGDRLARWCWTLAWVSFAVHVGVAFHHVHQWSHAAAFRHVEERSGFGPGIFVSYAFTLIWLWDVARWWARGAAARPPLWWVAVMLFITFNGAVVYESGPIRWVALAMFAALALRGCRQDRT